MVADQSLQPALQTLEAKITYNQAPSAMDNFARQIIARAVPFSLKMEGVSPDILESELITAIKQTGILDFIPEHTQNGMRIETQNDSENYCAKLEIGSHKLRIFLAQSAHELNLDGEKATYSEMQIYDGKGGRIEIEPPQTVSVRLTNTGTNMTVHNPLDPAKYDELQKATKNGPQLVALYYHDGNEGLFGIENDADATLGALLNAMISGELSIPEAIEQLQGFADLPTKAIDLLNALTEYHDLLTDIAPLQDSHDPQIIQDSIRELEDNIENLFKQNPNIPETILKSLQSIFNDSQNLAQTLGFTANTSDILRFDPETSENLIILIEHLSQHLETSEINELPPEFQDFMDDINGINTLISEYDHEDLAQKILDALEDPHSSDNSELSQAIQNITLFLRHSNIHTSLPPQTHERVHNFLEFYTASQTNIDALKQPNTVIHAANIFTRVTNTSSPEKASEAPPKATPGATRLPDNSINIIGHPKSKTITPNIFSAQDKSATGSVDQTKNKKNDATSSSDKESLPPDTKTENKKHIETKEKNSPSDSTLSKPASQNPHKESSEDLQENPQKHINCHGCADCNGDFKKVAGYQATQDNKIILKNQDGTTQTLSQKEAQRKIADEMAQHHNIDQNKWRDIVINHDGDDIKAREHVIDELRRGQEAADTIINTATSHIDTQIFDDAISRKIETMQATQDTNFHKHGAKGPFEHVCDDKCNHAHGANSETPTPPRYNSKSMNVQPGTARKRKFRGVSKQPAPAPDAS